MRNRATGTMIPVLPAGVLLLVAGCTACWLIDGGAIYKTEDGGHPWTGL